jgi:hypothetical protein
MEGDRCNFDNCPSTRWRQIDDGQEECENGHSRRSAFAIAVNDDDDFEGAVSGRTTRKEKEKKEKVLQRMWTIHNPRGFFTVAVVEY